MKKYLILILIFILLYFYKSVSSIKVSNKIEDVKIVSQDLTYAFINRGFLAGIEEGDIVISNDALIGIVDEVEARNSAIKLITADKNKVSIKTDNNVYGLIDGYQNGFLVMKGVKNNIEVGEKVFTTGISYIYSPDIYVGEVYELTESEILIKTPVNFDEISNIKILKK